MYSKKRRLFFVALLVLAIAVFYSVQNDVYAGKGTTGGGPSHGDDGSSGGKNHDDGSSDDNSGHKPKKKKPKKHWRTDGNANIDSDTHFLGTTDPADLVIKTDNTEKVRVTTDGDVGIGTASPTGTLHVEGGTASADTDGKDVTIEAQDGGPTTGLGGNIVLTPGIDGDGTSSGTVYVGEVDSLDPPILTLDVNGQIRIRGGSPFAGGVLTSDSDGIATWQSVDDDDADPTNELQALTQTGNSVTLSHGGGSVTVADNDNDSSNELQTISKTGNDITLSQSGGTVSVDDGDSNSTNEINTGISFDGTSLTVTDSGGNQTVDISSLEDDADADPTNELNATVELNGTNLEVTDAGGTKSADLSSLSDTDWTEGGGNVFRSAGSVGIGTSTPITLLHAFGASTGNIAVDRGDPVGGFASFDLFNNQNGGTGWSIQMQPNNNDLSFFDRAGGLTRVTIDQGTGKVGIGTATPGAKLHIGGWIGGGLRNWMDNGVIAGTDSDGGYFGVKDEGPNRKDTVIAWGDDLQDSLRFIFTLSGGAANGAEAMRITASGDIGIGTPSPGAKLDVTGQVKITGGVPGLGKVLTSDASGLATWEPIANDGDWTISGSNMSSGVTGNVGIGTASPNSKLDIAGNIALSGSGTTITTANTDLVLEQTGDVFGTTRLLMQNRLGSGGPLLENASINLVDIGFKPSTGPQSNLRLERRASFLVHAGNTNGEWQLIDDTLGTLVKTHAFGNSATIFNSGNVGIGTTTPDATLNVDKDLGGAGNGVTVAKVEIRNSSDTNYTLLNLLHGAASRFIVNGDGNVGIGTTTPGFNLDVTGDINFTGGLFLNGSPFVGSLWSGSGANVFRSTGNVGIGTNSPIASLDVAGEVALTSNSARLRLMRETGTNFIDYEDSNAFGIRSMNIDNTNIVDRLKIDTLGRFAIGTTNTGNAKFVINGDDTTSLRLENFGTTRESSMRFVTKTLNGSTNFHADIALKSTSNAGGVGYLGFKVPFNNSPGAGYDMVINSSGNVGIGTTTPQSKLSLGANLANTKLALWDNGIGGSIGLGIQNSTFRFHLNQASDAFRFYDAPAGNELMAILGNGNVAIGNTLGGKLSVAAINTCVRIGGALSGSEATGLQFYDQGTQHASLRWRNGSGTLVLEDSSNGANPTNWYSGQRVDFQLRNGRGTSSLGWVTSSDRRYKKNISELDNSLDKVMRLRGVRYDLKEEDSVESGHGKHLGVIAQEIEKEYPELVVTNEKTGYKAVAYDKLTAVLIEAVKELKTENDELRNKFTALADKHEAIVDMLLASSAELPKEKLASLIGKEKK